MAKPLSSQNSENMEISYYNSPTPGAIKTRSSAKARKNKVRQAMVKMVR